MNIFFEWINWDLFEWIIFLNEYLGFIFEWNIELNNFLAQFNEKMNIQNVLARAICQTPKPKNMNLDYTNTAYAEMPERPNMWYIFEKVIVQGCLLSLAQLYKV